MSRNMLNIPALLQIRPSANVQPTHKLYCPLDMPLLHSKNNFDPFGSTGALTQGEARVG